MNDFLAFGSRPTAALGVSSSVLIVSDEALVAACPRAVDGEILSSSGSSPARERCKGEGERATRDLNIELSLVLLLLAAASIDGHWSDCTCASSVKYGLGRGASGARFKGKANPPLSLLAAVRVGGRPPVELSSDTSVLLARG